MLTSIHEKKMYSEKELQIALLEHLIASNVLQNSLVASEVRYGTSQKRADILVVGDETHAYEIKSDFDSTARLKEQLVDYGKNFDFVSVLTTQTHVKGVRSIASKRVGLLVYDGQNVQIVRKSVQNKRLSKAHLASSCSRARLAQMLSGSTHKDSHIRIMSQALEQLTLEKLRNLAIAEYRDKFSESSASFSEEAASPIRETDLLLLRRRSKISFMQQSDPV